MYSRRPLRTVLLDAEDELLGVDSGMICIVDQLYVDEFLDVVQDVVQGLTSIGPTDHFAIGPAGVLCDTGGDGLFPLTAEVDDCAVHSFELLFDDDAVSTDPVRQIEKMTTPSGTIIIGDPAGLLQFVPDPFTAPVESWGCWAALSLPGPGVVTLCSMQSPSATGCTGVRAAWSPE
jgi:hypothetical protein